MRKIILALIISLVFGSSLFAQYSIDSVLNEIEKNNTTLEAMRKRSDADKLKNKTGIYIQNPEVAFDYMWGNPSVFGNRTDFSITQSFDFPSAYGYKNKISDIKNEQVALSYEKLRKELLLESRYVCYDLIYTNALMAELSKRLNSAQSIASSYKAKYELGETNILEYNKAQLDLLNLRKGIELLDIERTALIGNLMRLNGGITIEFTESEFQTLVIPVDFDQWYKQAEISNPLLNWLKMEIEISHKQVSLKKAMSLPKLQAGYVSEYIVGQKFQGFTVGISIPLWENKNTVKFSKANTIALEDIAVDKKVQLFNRLKILHAKAIELQNSSQEYKSELQLYNNTEYLIKALDKGHITLIEYILELTIYYESVNNLLELEKTLNKTIAELNQYL